MTRRAVVSVVALVTVIACAVVAASVAAWAGAQSEMADARGRREAGVNLALSGVQGVVAEVAKQRRDLLRGAALNLSAHTVVWTAADSGGAVLSGVVRLAPLSGQGELFQPEASKLDVNECDEDRLKALGALSSAELAKVMSGRSSRAWGSLWEIIELKGAPAPAASGPVVKAGPATTPDVTRGGQAAAPGGGASEGALEPRDVLNPPECLTCYSADPQERSGFGVGGALDPDLTGQGRVALPETWGPEIEARLKTDVSEAFATWMRNLYGANKRPASPSALAAAGVANGVEPVVLAAALDAIEFDDAGTRRGLVDLLTAPAEVLGTVPGITPALADRIVTARAKLESSRKATALWPVIEGLVELGEFAPALDNVTSRCMVFRVMVEGGVVRGELRGEASSWVLGDRWAYEVIVDASETPVRIAYLRPAPFDALVIPGAKEAESTTESTAREPEAAASADDAGPDAAASDASMASADESSDEERTPEGATLPRDGSGVDSPAASSGRSGGSSGPGVPTPAPATPARSRIGRWSGGGSGGAGGTPK